MSIAIILGIGFVAGIVTGLIGASGVMVIVPGLALLGYSAFDAIGASLFTDTIASFVVSWTYYQAGNLKLKEGWWIAVGSVLGAQLGSLLSPKIPETGLSGSFGIFLFVTAATFWLRGRKKKTALLSKAPAAEMPTENALVKLLRKNVVLSSLGLGMLVGILSGLLGAGGGVLILLILVFVLGYKMHEGIGTSTFIMAFTAASGTVGHALTGNLPMKAAAFSAVGTVVGSRLAARYANRVDEALLSKIVGVVFAVLGIAMLILS
ncbi:MAG: sulfite exporter TauE/SafE family protein [Anaerolineales bacterium]